MGTGICYTWSGTEKRYEPEELGEIPSYVTGYTVGYPSTAYYSDAFYGLSNFYCFAYPGPPGYPQSPGFTEGTAEYLFNLSFNGTDSNSTYKKIYDLMTDTPPDGYVLDENGDYIVTTIATVYTCNLDVKYGGVINSINNGARTIKRQFKYKKKDSKVYVRLSVSNDVIINGNIYHPYEDRPTINTIDLESGDGSVMNILVGLDSNHFTGAFDVIFDDVSVSNKKIYLLANNKYYEVDNSTSTESKRCDISKYENHYHVAGDMYTTAGFDYTFYSNDWENNSLFTQEGTKDNSGGFIPSNVKAKFVVKFTLSNGYSHQDCQLTVGVTTNK